MTRMIWLTVLLGGCAAGPVAYEGDDAGECADGADNDADGLFDCEDEDCMGSPVCAPTTPTVIPPIGTTPTGSTPTTPTTSWDGSFAIGTTLPNLSFIDDQANTVLLHDELRDYTVLSAQAMWSGPGQALAGETPDVLSSHASHGLAWVTVLVEDVEGGDPSTADASLWSDTFGLVHPVLIDPDGHTDPLGPTWPHLVLLDRDGKVVANPLPVNADDLCADLAGWTGGPTWCGDYGTTTGTTW